MFYGWLDRNRDSFLLCLFFMAEADCCSLSMTCKSFDFVASDQQVWREYAITRIPWLRDEYGHMSESHKQERVLNPLLHAFSFPSYRSLHQCLHRCTFSPFNSILRFIPRDLHTCRGGLWRLNYETEVGICIQALQFGNERTLAPAKVGKVTFSYHPEFRCIQALNYAWIGGHPERVDFLEDGIAMTPFLAGEDPDDENNTQLMKTLPPLKSDDTSIHDTIGNQLDTCFGYVCAMYGSHGIEILHISIHSALDVTAVQNTDSIAFGDIQLQGLKLTGDPNVPAANLSFCMNISNHCDIDAEIARDARLLVMFDVPGDIALIDVQTRRPNIKLWTRGYGQINIDPMHWNPQWVGCSMIVYDQVRDGLAFTVVWDDEFEQFRHAMDFRHCELTQS